MKNLDRRQWLKAAGLTGSLAFMGGFNSLDASTAIKKPLSTSAGNMVRLSANENPYGPSKVVKDAIVKSFDNACRYPFAYMDELVTAIAKKEGVSKDHVVVTGGSTEGLKAAGLTYSIGNGEIIAADPTFTALMEYAEQFGAYVHRVPLNDKLEHDLSAMAKRLTSRTRLVFLCNPNNPTGTLLDRNMTRDFCDSVSEDAVVFSDEAYYDFIEEENYPSMVSLVKEGKNVIVSKTFSKVYGLAGIRIGYLIARPDIASRLSDNIMANTNVLGIAAAVEALKDDEFYNFSLGKVKECKSMIYKTLDELKLPYIKSHGNFVFFKSGRPIERMILDMKNENVQIGRPFPPLYDWVRISAGTVDEVKAFNDALKKVMV
uniref:pyridoxal phosphate-dependent aminotransferase n=1 Tax=Fulvivirga sp. TaxID=1931237 RepID=UPI00404B7459